MSIERVIWWGFEVIGRVLGCFLRGWGVVG